MRLGKVLRKYRLISELNLREMASVIGISFPTLQRIETGRAIDAKTLVVILNWLMGEEKTDA